MLSPIELKKNESTIFILKIDVQKIYPNFNIKHDVLYDFFPGQLDDEGLRERHDLNANCGYRWHYDHRKFNLQ